MEQKTAELISDSLLQMAKKLGLDPIQIVGDFGKSLTGKKLSKTSLSEATRTFREYWNSHLLEPLKKAPEPSPQQLGQIMAGCKNFPPFVRQIVMEKIKNIPKAGAGGAPRLLSKNNEARLCALIDSDRSGGAETPEAIRRAATRFGVSYWTAKRAWRRYVEGLPRTQMRRGSQKRSRRT